MKTRRRRIRVIPVRLPRCPECQSRDYITYGKQGPDYRYHRCQSCGEKFCSRDESDTPAVPAPPAPIPPLPARATPRERRLYAERTGKTR